MRFDSGRQRGSLTSALAGPLLRKFCYGLSCARAGGQRIGPNHRAQHSWWVRRWNNGGTGDAFLVRWLVQGASGLRL